MRATNHMLGNQDSRYVPLALSVSKFDSTSDNESVQPLEKSPPYLDHSFPIADHRDC